jgi:diaminopropionate ammonia-lyase
MPKGSAVSRFENIRKENADVLITDLNYDDTVRLAAADAKKNGWVLVQDTAWEGYETIPKVIMQGYLTMALEAYEQMQRQNVVPTHIIIQAGVGALASAVTGFFTNAYHKNKPKIIIAEPQQADCIFRTAKANDGALHTVSGDMNTIMAGLACGEPISIGWPILRDYADAFFSCSDFLAAEGMRILAHPEDKDARIVSGESGAIGIGIIKQLMTNPDYAPLGNALQLDTSSKVLCFSTEGATDPENYEKIVFGGAYSSGK